MNLSLVVNIFTFKQAIAYLEDYWYWNPQDISCFEEKYFEIAKSEPRLPGSPKEFYKKNACFFAYSTLFGESYFTYKEAVEYCSNEYNKLSDDEKPSGLRDFYLKLRDSEPRLPCNSDQHYKDKGYVSTFSMFSLDEVNFFSYEEAVKYCTKQYYKLPDNEKPTGLLKFYKTLRSANPKLPSAPDVMYKSSGYSSPRSLFGLDDVIFFSYEEAAKYCTKQYNKLHDERKRTDLQSYYIELANNNPNLPTNPQRFYKGKGYLSLKIMFGLDDVVLYSYDEAVKYCTREYNKLLDNEKKPGLNNYYCKLRDGNPRLPAAPLVKYKDKDNFSLRIMFGLDDVALFSYEEAVKYCTREYARQPDNKKPTDLNGYYQQLRKNEARFPSNPSNAYKGKGFISFASMFGLAT